jgi:hypothetical protein
MKQRLPYYNFIALAILVIIFSNSSSLLAQPQNGWAQKVGSSSEVRSQVIDKSGNIYCSGYFSGSVDFDNSTTGAFIMNSANGRGYVLKLNSAGDFIWAIQFQVQHSPVLALDADENLYIGGNTHENNPLDLNPGPGEEWHVNNLPGYADVFIVKLDPSGAYLWGKAMGSNYLDNAVKVQTDPKNGGVFLLGSFYDGGDFDPGPNTFLLQTQNPEYSENFILKLDNDGDFAWAYSFKLGISSIESNNNGDLLVTGGFHDTYDFDPGIDTFLVTAVGSDGFLLSLSAGGTLQWVKQFETASAELFMGSSISSVTIDKTGNIFLAGTNGSEIDLDPGPGVYTFPFTQGDGHHFYVKLNPLGEFIWAVGYAQPMQSYGTSPSRLSTDEQGNLYVTGSLTGTMDFDPGIGVLNLTSNGQFDIYVLKLLKDGQFSWAFQIGGPSYDNGLGLNIDSSNNLILSGNFRNIVDFNPGPAVNNMFGGTSGNGFVAKFPQTTSPTLQPIPELAISIFPNPTTDWLQTLGTQSGQVFTIYNDQSAVVLSGRISGPGGKIYVGGIPSGSYFIKIGNKGTRIIKL